MQSGEIPAKSGIHIEASRSSANSESLWVGHRWARQGIAWWEDVLVHKMKEQLTRRVLSCFDEVRGMKGTAGNKHATKPWTDAATTTKAGWSSASKLLPSNMAYALPARAGTPPAWSHARTEHARPALPGVSKARAVFFRRSLLRRGWLRA